MNTEIIRNIDLFANCGNKTSVIPISIGYQFVDSWAEATAFASGIDRGNACLEASGTLTRWLSDHHLEQFNQWNDAVDICKDLFNGAVDIKLNTIASELKLADHIADLVRWDLVLVLLEHYFDIEDMPHLASTILLPVYESGHFPCGWWGNEFPDGMLYVW